MQRFACHIIALLLALGTFSADVGWADEPVYFRQRVADLQFDGGKLGGSKTGHPILDSQLGLSARPHVVLDGDGEGYWCRASNLGPEDYEPDDRWGMLCIKVPKPGADVSGQVFFLSRNGDKLGNQKVRFKISADRANADFHKSFLFAKIEHYQLLANAGVPGGAWFRHQLQLARTELGESTETLRQLDVLNVDRGATSFDNTYSLFSGGRAVSENLQLDRPFAVLQSDKNNVPIEKLSGITVAEIDWTALIAGKQPQLDALASYVPADQHVVFFPAFASLLQLVDEADRQGTLVLQAAEPRAEDFGVAARYQRQLGLQTTALGRVLGPKVIASVALTGGDPYFRIGTDIAVLFEAKDVAALRAMLIGQITLNTAKVDKVTPSAGQILGVGYQAWQSPGRRVSSYLATIDRTVVVTNSLEQLKRLAETKQGGRKAIASLDEYKFFRDRYPRGEASETALLFLSDATIRRWCGPQWRIADSRRIRDLAVLSDAQAAAVPQLAAGSVTPGPVQSDYQLSGGGAIELAPGGVRSPTAGTIEFMTPISERPLMMVSRTEADAYARWRNGYQSNFRWAFDPIALRLTVAGNRLAADLTVMPLIASSDYNTWIDLTRGITLKAESGDPHDTIAHIIVALNRDSEQMKQWAGIGQVIAPELKVDPLSWIGQSASLYVEDSPLWNELAKLGSDAEREGFMERRGWNAPVAVNIEIDSTLKAAAFLTGLRAYVEQTNPGILRWENLRHGEQGYVKISMTERAARPGGANDDIAIFYVLTGGSLTISPNEQLIQRVLERAEARFADRTNPKPPGTAAAEKPKPATKQAAQSAGWLGDSLALDIGTQGLHALAAVWGPDYQTAMQRLAWSNLPILNEWKRRFPEQDPVKLHERLWGVRLISPAGEYAWNDRWQTMESTVYGHPCEPQAGPLVPPMIGLLEQARLGLTFEKQGLRARAELLRKKP